jgi:hypothetical protein
MHGAIADTNIVRYMVDMWLYMYGQFIEFLLINFT